MMTIPEELLEADAVEEALEEMFEGFIQSPLCDPQTTPEVYMIKKALVKFIHQINEEYATNI